MNKKKLRRERNFSHSRIVKISLMSVASFLFLIITKKGYAESPTAAFIARLGENLTLTRGEAIERRNVVVEDQINPGDTLYVPPSRLSWAWIGFVKSDGLDYDGLILKTLPYLERESEYQFPCKGNLGVMTIAWRPSREGRRQCGEGLVVERDPNNINEIYPEVTGVQNVFSQMLGRKSLDNDVEAQLSDDLTIQPGEEGVVIRITSKPVTEERWILEKIPDHLYDAIPGEYETRKVRVETEVVNIEVLEGEVAVSSEKKRDKQSVREGETYSYPEDNFSEVNSAKEANTCEILAFLNAAYWTSENTTESITGGIQKQLENHRKSIGVAGSPPPSLSSLEQGIFDELNFVRSNPSGYAELVKEKEQYFYNNYLNFPGDNLNRAARMEALNEAVDFLKLQRSLPEFTLSQGMSNASRDLIEIQSSNDYGHASQNDPSGTLARLSTYGSVGCASYDEDEFENVIYFEPPTGQDNIPPHQAVVMEMLIRERLRVTGRRENIFNPDLQVTGIACGLHGNSSHEMCVITYADGYIENVE